MDDRPLEGGTEPSRPCSLAGPIGPVFEAADLMEWRGVSRHDVDELRESGGVLALLTSDEVWVFPAWQFDERGDVREGVSEAMAALASGGMDTWTQALWFRGASPKLDGESAAAWLVAGKDPASVTLQARRTANRWRQ